MVHANEKVADLTQYEVVAKQKLPKMVFDFYAGGAEDEHTLKENVAAFHRIRLRPTTLLEVKQVDLSTTLLGLKISMPIMIAPTSMHRMAHPEGELATARAAMSLGTIMMLSFTSTCSIEEVAAIGDSVRFFQVFVYKRRDIIEELVRRAEKAGYKAIILTGDTQRLGRREADIRNRFALPPHLTFKNLEGLIPVQMDKSKGSGLPALTNDLKDRSLCWKRYFLQGEHDVPNSPLICSIKLQYLMDSPNVQDIQWLKSITHLPILVKGIMTGEDAAIAVQAGVSGVIVSNHGGRQLDYVPPTIAVLEEVVLAVGGRVLVLFDGGIRCGRDVFKAIALGADAVLIGRPVIFGLAVDGEIGVRNVLQQLHDELRSTMILAGCSSLKDIRRSHVQTKHEKLFSKL